MNPFSDPMHPEAVVKDVVGYPSDHNLDLFVPVQHSLQETRDFLLAQPPPEATDSAIKTEYQLFPGYGSAIDPTGTIPESVSFLSRFSIYLIFSKNGRRGVNGAAAEKSERQQTRFGGCDSRCM
jgi:hypothetical protein